MFPAFEKASRRCSRRRRARVEATCGSQVLSTSPDQHAPVSTFNITRCIAATKLARQLQNERAAKDVRQQDDQGQKAPPDAVAASRHCRRRAALLAPFDASAGSAATAARVASALGWPALSGFAIYELEASPNEFVAKEWHWNQHPRNIWVDFMPRSAEHADILLVEADVNAAFDRAGVLRDAPAANKPRLQTAPPMDISDTPAKPPPPQPPKPPLVEQQEEDDDAGGGRWAQSIQRARPVL